LCRRGGRGHGRSAHGGLRGGSLEEGGRGHRMFQSKLRAILKCPFCACFLSAEQRSPGRNCRQPAR
jgi:hypothetical protein